MGRPQHILGVQRQKVEGFEERTEQQYRDHHRQHLDELSQLSAEHQQGQKGENRRHRRGEYRRKHLHRPFQRRLFGGHALLDVAVDVLRHDDRLVHQHPQGDQRPEEREHVETVMQDLQRHETDHEADGNTDGDDQCDPGVDEEQHR